MARGLHALGVRRGDRVAIVMPNCMEYVEAMFGASLLGAVVVTINARYRAAELAYVVADSAATVLLTSDVPARGRLRRPPRTRPCPGSPSAPTPPRSSSTARPGCAPA